jgi:hypothetical protein
MPVPPAFHEQPDRQADSGEVLFQDYRVSD